jgi:hypothetical protein
VRFGCVLFVRRAVTDVAVQNDEGRPAFRLLEYSERLFDTVNVIGIGPRAGRSSP